MLILEVSCLTAKENGRPIFENLSFSIDKGQQIAITGPSGSGKTTLLHCIGGKRAYSGKILLNNEGDATVSSRVVLVEQQHRFKNLSNTSTFYYQQRFNSFDSEDAVTVQQDLQYYIPQDSQQPEGFSGDVTDILRLLHLEKLLSVKLIQLSNGENKRLQIAKALLLRPSILLLDSPFTGLDTIARTTLHSLLADISGKGIHLILTAQPHHIPSFVTHVLTLDNRGSHVFETKEAFTQKAPVPAAAEPLLSDGVLLISLTENTAAVFEFAVKMKAVNIVYNSRTILEDINWQVRRGERWSLTGPNGAGKSTLLSLINADNPQAYANEIYLFDRRRGTGESIWDIKKRIGYISPELHLYFDTGITSYEVVASGLFDTIGLFRFLNEAQEMLVMDWMRLLGLETLSRKPLYQLSNSQQRLVLLARALVKNPSMLILDEPCQGLDDHQIALFKGIINEVCMQSDKTLIYVSHYPDEIPECVDKFIRLENGKRAGSDWAS